MLKVTLAILATLLVAAPAFAHGNVVTGGGVYWDSDEDDTVDPEENYVGVDIYDDHVSVTGETFVPIGLNDPNGNPIVTGGGSIVDLGTTDVPYPGPVHDAMDIVGPEVDGAVTTVVDTWNNEVYPTIEPYDVLAACIIVAALDGTDPSACL